MKGHWFGRLISGLTALLVSLVGLYYFLWGFWFAAVGFSSLFDKSQPHRRPDNSSHLFIVFLGLMVMTGAVFLWIEIRRIRRPRKMGVENGPQRSAKSKIAAIAVVGVLAVVGFVWNASLHSGPPRAKSGLNLRYDTMNSDMPVIYIRGQMMLITNRTESDWKPIYIGLNPGEKGLVMSQMPGHVPTLSPGYGGYAARVAVIKAGQIVSVPLSRFKTTDGRTLDPKTTVLTDIQTECGQGGGISGSSGGLTPE